MRHGATVVAGFGLGLGLMYLMDPERGRDRRARVRDRVARAAQVGGHTAAVAGRTLLDRAADATAHFQSLSRKTVDDDVLIERIRAQIDQAVSFPHAIEIDSAGGIVTLRGPIPQWETDTLLSTVQSVRGVREVVSELEQHKMTWNVPALRGASTLPRVPATNGERQSSPATRVLTGTTGIALAGYGALRRDGRGALLAAAGMVLVARAAAA
jgi:hypothetical protein